MKQFCVLDVLFTIENDFFRLEGNKPISKLVGECHNNNFAIEFLY